METITIYTTTWCPDCRHAKSFLKERGVSYREVNIEEDESGEEIVIKANNGKRKFLHSISEAAILPAAPSIRSSSPKNLRFH
jgi:arsenate reductase-like glutaredoxin family protein